MDLALVDGAYRDHTAKSALPKIKPGGLLIIYPLSQKNLQLCTK